MATPISSFRRLVPAVGLSLAVAAAAALAVPAPPSPEVCPPIDPPAPTGPAAQAEAGLRVFIDPVTGKMRPATPEERRKVAEAASGSRAGRSYEMRIRPDGTRIVELDDAFRMSVVATANPDGTISYRCVTESAPESCVETRK
jgi:hypothetical protein